MTTVAPIYVLPIKIYHTIMISCGKAKGKERDQSERERELRSMMNTYMVITKQKNISYNKREKKGKDYKAKCLISSESICLFFRASLSIGRDFNFTGFELGLNGSGSFTFNCASYGSSCA